MSKHTPGPWNLKPAKNSIAIMGPLDKGCCEEVARCQSWNATADARLIAKAPKMYEFLKTIAAFLDNPEAADWKDGKPKLCQEALSILSEIEGD